MDISYYRFTLRLPSSLKKWLEDRAKTKHRTLTSELVEMIREKKEAEERAAQTAQR